MLKSVLVLIAILGICSCPPPKKAATYTEKACAMIEKYVKIEEESTEKNERKENESTLGEQVAEEPISFGVRKELRDKCVSKYYPSLQKHSEDCYREMFDYELPKTNKEIMSTLCADPEKNDKQYQQYILCLQGRVMSDEKVKDPKLTDYEIKQKLMQTFIKTCRSY